MQAVTIKGRDRAVGFSGRSWLFSDIRDSTPRSRAAPDATRVYGMAMESLGGST